MNESSQRPAKLLSDCLQESRCLFGAQHWVEDKTLHYVTTQNTHNQASLDLIDLTLTKSLNQHNDVPFAIRVEMKPPGTRRRPPENRKSERAWWLSLYRFENPVLDASPPCSYVQENQQYGWLPRVGELIAHDFDAGFGFNRQFFTQLANRDAAGDSPVSSLPPGNSHFSGCS